MNRDKARRKRRPGRRYFSPHQPINVVLGLDGQVPHPGDPACPLCAMLAAQRDAAAEVGDREVDSLARRAAPPMIEVRVEADATTSAHIDAAAFTERVPDGCSARDFAEYICFTRPALRRAFGAGALRLRDGRGRILPLGHELSDGDSVVLTHEAIR